MANKDSIRNRNSSSFRWFSKSKTFCVVDANSKDRRVLNRHNTYDRMTSLEGAVNVNNISAVTARNNMCAENGGASGANTACLTVRNNVYSAQTSLSDESSGTSRQSSVDSSSSTCSSEGMNNSDIVGLKSSTPCPCRSVPSSPTAPKIKLIEEGDIQVCRLNHTRTVISKILSSKFLRRWENHHLYLSETEIYSKTAAGFMEESVPYSFIEDTYVIARWDATQKYCVRIVIPDGSLLLQVNNAYVRDQWLYSLQWKRNMMKYQKLLERATRPEVLLKELKNLTDLCLTTPLQDDSIYNYPLTIISQLVQKDHSWIPKSQNEDIISVISPLLEVTTPPAEICDFFCKHCQENPRSRIVKDTFTPIVQRILKHNMDFGKYPKTRIFVQEYLQALSFQNDGRKVLEDFISSVHGVSTTCPHTRVLPNLVSICLAAVYSLYEERRSETDEDRNDNEKRTSDWESRLLCFITVLEILSTYEDWRPSLAQLLQPIPFPDDALAHGLFTTSFKPIIENISNDRRCSVHLMVLGVRDEKDGWLHFYCPGGIACDDDGDLWSSILKSLLSCCCQRKRFLERFTKYIGPCMLRALRDDETLQSALCSMLELEVIENKDLQLQLITTLQSTETGRKHYAALCQRQEHLRELQQKGGPRKLTLPSRSTDADVAKLLSCGSFGNLECLSLAFTQVTSVCAEQLIKLPSLRYLNVWSTQFGDLGLQLISEHLHKLQVLNLCETPVTDKGLLALAALKNLRKLNLNSTNLSAQTFEKLKQTLPALQECDIRYTDAW